MSCDCCWQKWHEPQHKNNESALVGRRGAPPRGTASCCLKASSPIARRPFRRGFEDATLSQWMGSTLANGASRPQWRGRRAD
eukprot:4326870-Alexandrium_andersonii.AAC.1